VSTPAIQYRSAPKFEISTGVVVPFRSYNNFSVGLTQAGATTTSGTCPSDQAACPIVVNPPVTAFVPGVFVNIPLGNELARPRERIAFLLSGFAGYNSARSAASIGVGPSLSVGSLVVNLPVLFDRDQELAGQFILGGSAGTATTPMTKNVWRVSPSLGISLRLPVPRQNFIRPRH
jgi:hypothetical protein